MTLEGYNVKDGTRYRTNPKLPAQVEYQMKSGRWQIIQTCRTREEANALLARLVAETKQEARG